MIQYLYDAGNPDAEALVGKLLKAQERKEPMLALTSQEFNMIKNKQIIKLKVAKDRRT